VPPRDWRIRIEDIIEAATAIAGYVQGLSFEEFGRDRKTVDAVVRNLEVIGEAARHVPEEVRARFPELPWSDMADMRNVLIHEYFGVDLTILWKTASIDLPAILPALRRVIEGS
jgi:uncharacterized protein with HEPN domain